MLGMSVLAGASGCAWTTRVSLGNGGVQGNGIATSAAISDDGHLVAFASQADNLVGILADTNGVSDVFVRDVPAGTTSRVSVATGGAQGNGASSGQTMSGDGRYVAFASSATNLVAGDTNNRIDTFVRDRTAGTTTRVSVATNGTQGNGTSWQAQVSGTGRYVVFASDATNLVTGDTNSKSDVFLRDTVTGVTERVSVNSSEQQFLCRSDRPTVSDDGRYVAFVAYACGLPGMPPIPGSDVLLRDRTEGTTRVVGHATDIPKPLFNGYPRISGDGFWVVYITDDDNLVFNDDNDAYDAFLYNTVAGGVLERVSVGTNGLPGNASVGAPASISDDGRFVAFYSDATNLVPDGDTNDALDAFVYDRLTRLMNRVGTEPLLAQGNAQSVLPEISGDGKYVAFVSEATNIVGGDTNGQMDVFLRATEEPVPQFINPSTVGRGFVGQVTVTGLRFNPGATMLGTTDKVSFSNAVRVDDKTMTATVTVAADAPKTFYDVVVVNPGGAWLQSAGTAGRCLGCLRVN